MANLGLPFFETRELYSLSIKPLGTLNSEMSLILAHLSKEVSIHIGRSSSFATEAHKRKRNPTLPLPA